MIALVQNNQVSFDEITHTYFNRDGVELIGVTSLMKKMGVAPDYTGIPQEVLEAAAAKGTILHKAIEDYCIRYRCGEKSDEPLSNDMRAFESLNIHPRIIANEYLVSDNENIASSIDIVAQTEKDDEVDLIDTKRTSTVHKDAVSWQLSIYRKFFEAQNPHLKVRNLYCLHFHNENAKLIPIQGKSKEEVDELISCYLEGRDYIPKDIVPSENIGNAMNVLTLLEQTIKSLETQVKEAKQKQEEARQCVLEFMKAHHLKKWVMTEGTTFTYVLPSNRISLDGTRLKEEKPEIYNEYLKDTPVKESLKITIKNK